MFLPDIASYHYARQTKKRLQIENIPVVPKEDSPRNVPQVRSIQEFLVLLSITI